MHTEDKAILDYLKTWPNTFVTGKEIARKSLGRKKYDEDPGWAIPILAQMVRMGIVEKDQLGCYRLIAGKGKKDRERRHLSPQILRILKSSGKTFEAVEIDDEDEEPIPLYGQPRPPRPR